LKTAQNYFSSPPPFVARTNAPPLQVLGSGKF